MCDISVVIPAKNEAKNLACLLPKLTKVLPDAEIIVVDDGSTDATIDICQQHQINVISHSYSMGNGAAVKTGARAAQGRTLVFMDADGQHDPAVISKLLLKLSEGFDMVVGARHADTHASIGRWGANAIYNRVAGWMVGRKIEDLTSGFRAVRADKFREFLHLLPNGFSYPTTITMAFFRSGYTVAYAPIHAHARGSHGKSHINLLRDGTRFFLIIFKIGTLYSPLKVFFPVSLVHFLVGIGHYAYTYFSYGRFTNMSALLLIVSVLIFLIGLVSEQITMLLYSERR